jgi:hypothetical protein
MNSRSWTLMGRKPLCGSKESAVYNPVWQLAPCVLPLSSALNRSIMSVPAGVCGNHLQHDGGTRPQQGAASVPLRGWADFGEQQRRCGGLLVQQLSGAVPDGAHGHAVPVCTLLLPHRWAPLTIVSIVDLNVEPRYVMSLLLTLLDEMRCWSALWVLQTALHVWNMLITRFPLHCLGVTNAHSLRYFIYSRAEQSV